MKRKILPPYQPLFALELKETRRQHMELLKSVIKVASFHLRVLRSSQDALMEPEPLRTLVAEAVELAAFRRGLFHRRMMGWKKLPR